MLLPLSGVGPSTFFLESGKGCQKHLKRSLNVGSLFPRVHTKKGCILRPFVAYNNPESPI